MPTMLCISGTTIMTGNEQAQQFVDVLCLRVQQFVDVLCLRVQQFVDVLCLRVLSG
jgi:hypothetical protein